MLTLFLTLLHPASPDIQTLDLSVVNYYYTYYHRSRQSQLLGVLVFIFSTERFSLKVKKKLKMTSLFCCSPLSPLIGIGRERGKKIQLIVKIQLIFVVYLCT